MFPFEFCSTHDPDDDFEPIANRNYQAMAKDVRALAEEELHLDLEIEKLRVLTNTTPGELSKKITELEQNVLKLEGRKAELISANERLKVRRDWKGEQRLEKRKTTKPSDLPEPPGPIPFSVLSDDEEDIEPPKAVARYRTRYEIQMDRRIKLAFDEMDNDGSKSLDRDEIMQVMERLDPQMTEADINSAVQKIDANSDGLITFDEFRDWCRHGDKTALGSAFSLDAVVSKTTAAHDGNCAPEPKLDSNDGSCPDSGLEPAHQTKSKIAIEAHSAQSGRQIIRAVAK